MNTMKQYQFSCRFSVTLIIRSLVFLGMLGIGLAASAKEYSPVQWVDLIPRSDLDALLNPPASIMSIPEGSVFDMVLNDSLANSFEQAIQKSKEAPTPEEQAYYAALESTQINAGFNEKDIRIPGFVVPIEYDENQVITEFFLVPYFGACIHVPPPPPNQIIYVKYPKGFSVEVLNAPFWIEGKLLTQIVENDVAMSAYTMDAESVKPY